MHTVCKIKNKKCLRDNDAYNFPQQLSKKFCFFVCVFHEMEHENRRSFKGREWGVRASHRFCYQYSWNTEEIFSMI